MPQEPRSVSEQGVHSHPKYMPCSRACGHLCVALWPKTNSWDYMTMDKECCRCAEPSQVWFYNCTCSKSRMPTP